MGTPQEEVDMVHEPGSDQELPRAVVQSYDTGYEDMVQDKLVEFEASSVVQKLNPYNGQVPNPGMACQ
jgi:hypothetical protein